MEDKLPPLVLHSNAIPFPSPSPCHFSMTFLFLSRAYRLRHANFGPLNKNRARATASRLLYGSRTAGSSRRADEERTGFSAAAPHDALVQRVVKAFVLLIALMSSGPGWAAGLGRLTLTSAVGQPFQAEIELVAVKNEEKPVLTASLASQQIFHQANVAYSPLLATFQASVEIRSNGQPYVRIVSSQPVAEPLLNLLVELSWPSGRLVREYAVVLASPPNDGLSRPRRLARTPPPVPAESELLSAKTYGIDPWELVRVLVTDADTEQEALKQNVIGKIAPAPEVSPVSINEKEAPRDAPQLSTGMEPERAHGEVNTSAGANGGDSGPPPSLHATEEDATAKRSLATKGPIGEGNESIALLEKNSEDAHRPLEQKKPDLEQKQAEALTTGRDKVPALAVGTQSAQSAPSSPMQSETIHSVKATSPTSISEVTDEPVAVAKAMRAAWVSNSPDLETSSSGAAERKHTVADWLTMNLIFLGGALVLLITGFVGVSIALTRKGARSPSAGNVVVAPVIDSPASREALPETRAGLSAGGALLAAKFQNTSGAKSELNSPLPGVSVDAPTEGRERAKMKKSPPFSRASGDTSSPSGHGFLLEATRPGVVVNRDVRSADVWRGPLLERGMRWHEILSRLDLARAYQEMGDKDAAQEVLREVIRDGDAAQRESARRILANL
jgi:FimV-like protein